MTERKGATNLFRRVKNAGHEIYWIVGKGVTTAHLAVDGLTVCKKIEAPYAWDPDPEMKRFTREVRRYRRAYLTPNICDRCLWYLRKILSVQQVPNLRAPKSLNTHPVHWTCQMMVDKTEEKIKRELLKTVRTIKITTEICGFPAMCAQYPVCTKHSKAWQDLEKIVSTDVANMVKPFLGV